MYTQQQLAIVDSQRRLIQQSLLHRLMVLARGRGDRAAELILAGRLRALAVEQALLNFH